MVLTLYLLLPVAFCLIWVLIHAIIASRTDSFKLFAALFSVCGIYIFSEACHAILEPSSPMDTIATLIGQLAGPCVVPLLITYLRRLEHSTRDNPLSFSWVIIPSVLFTAGVLLYLMSGSEKADRLFYLFTVNIYNTVLAVELGILVIFALIAILRKKIRLGSFYSFLFKGGDCSITLVQTLIGSIPMIIMSLRIGLAHNLYSMDQWLVVLIATMLSFSAFMFGLFALLGQKSSIRISDLKLMLRFNYNNSNKADAVEEMLNDLLDEAEDEALGRIRNRLGENLDIEQWKSGDVPREEMPIVSSHIFNALADSWDEGSLISRFQHIMMEEQLFLQPRLTLDDVSERLNSNKTYVSKMVNNTYNLSFPELINTLRVDYAEQYILSHREAKQEQIASACGFLSASSFNTIFKKITGMTPKVWIASTEQRKKQ